MMKRMWKDSGGIWCWKKKNITKQASSRALGCGCFWLKFECLLRFRVCTEISCPGCHRKFRRPVDIGNHFLSKSSCHSTWLASSVANDTTTTRCRPTISKKCRILEDLVKLERKHVPLAHTVLRSMHPGISAKNISDWSAQREKLFSARDLGLGKCRSLVLASRVQFPDQEDALYLAFYWRRMILTLKTGDDWLVEMMKEVLEADQPQGWADAKLSNGWLYAFKKRFRISSQCLTNKKNVLIVQKVPLLKKFHTWLQDLQRQGVQRCPKYGRFPAKFMFHMVTFLCVFFKCRDHKHLIVILNLHIFGMGLTYV